MDNKRYMLQRKKNLIELRNLIYNRTKLNMKIRSVQRDMDSWDKALLSSEEDE